MCFLFIHIHMTIQKTCFWNDPVRSKRDVGDLLREGDGLKRDVTDACRNRLREWRKGKIIMKRSTVLLYISFRYEPIVW